VQRLPNLKNVSRLLQKSGMKLDSDDNLVGVGQVRRNYQKQYQQTFTRGQNPKAFLDKRMMHG
jgi:hypothetical protein